MISTSLGTGTDFVNLNNETGIVVKPMNIKELSQAMNKIFRDKKMQEKYGENAYKRYKLLFNEDVQSVKYNNIYKKLIK